MVVFTNTSLKTAANEWIDNSTTATAKYGDIEEWDVSNVTDMSGLFADAATFNQDISGWIVSQVTEMSSLFNGAGAFNRDIKGWDVSNVRNMSGMFSGAGAFNQDISGWNVSNVKNMTNMFNGATAFNQNIGGWNVNQVTDMVSMFSDAASFNQNISGWDVRRIPTIPTGFGKVGTNNPVWGEWPLINTSLSSMSLYDVDEAPISLSPGFITGTRAYTASVSYTVSTISVMAEKYAGAGATAVIAVRGEPVTSGPFSLSVGTNTIAIAVTPAPTNNNSTTTNYAIWTSGQRGTLNGIGFTITGTLRGSTSSSNNITYCVIKNNDDWTITFDSPMYDLNLYCRKWRVANYTFNIPFSLLLGSSNFLSEAESNMLSVEALPVTGGVYTQATGIVHFSGPVTSFSVNSTVGILIGSQYMTFGASASDNFITSTYTTIVTRAAASSDATLSKMYLGDSQMSPPVLVAGTLTYEVSVANSVSSITLTPVVNQLNATVTVNGRALALSGSIELSVGEANTITTLVEAQNGSMLTYTTTVTRTKAHSTFTLSFDKTTYSPGETATITVNLYDETGAQIISSHNDYDDYTNILTADGLSFSTATSNVASGDGKKTYLVNMPYVAGDVTVTATGSTGLPLAARVAQTATATVIAADAETVASKLAENAEAAAADYVFTEQENMRIELRARIKGLETYETLA